MWKQMEWTNKETEIRHILEFVISFRTNGIEYDISLKWLRKTQWTLKFSVLSTTAPFGHVSELERG